MKRPMFKAYQIKEVMAMETDLYQIHHHPRLAERLHIQQNRKCRAFRQM